MVRVACWVEVTVLVVVSGGGLAEVVRVVVSVTVLLVWGNKVPDRNDAAATIMNRTVTARISFIGFPTLEWF